MVTCSQYMRSKYILFIRDKAKAFPDIIFIRIRQRKRMRWTQGIFLRSQTQKKNLKRDKHYVMFLKLPDHP